ncbi:odorant receptor 22b isoform X2 [Megalopta genalis]|uniref:odorant receptor 22b isoform X2 n=1 Tax=Megalopta genalis TaxID=115081 RepID=UPI003FD3479A
MNMSLEAPEQADYKWAVTLNRYPLWLLGLWPPENNRGESLLDKLRAPVIFIFIQIFLIFPLGCVLLLQSQGLMMCLENIGYFTPCMISMMKFVIMYRNKTNFIPLLKMMASDWEKPKTDIERDVMIKRAAISRTFMKFCYSTFGPILFTMTVLPKLATAFCYLGFDVFYGTVILHITAQLENLQTRLASIKSSDRFDHDLADIVMDHTRLSSAVDIMENTYMLLLLVLLIYFGVFNCVYIFEIVFALTGKGKFDSAGIYYYVGSYVNTLAQMTLYCVAGQLLTTQSEGMFDAAYGCNWTNLEPNEAKNLVLIMLRAKKTFYLTAGKLFPINMPTLCNILKISLSYISFLLTRV